MKTHWLYGKGPNKEVVFNVEIDEENDCTKCVHNKVCMRKMEKFCLNYEFGTSEYTGCDSCLHRFTRWDKEPIACFCCSYFISK